MRSLFTPLFVYKLNKYVREISKSIIGNYFEPGVDLCLVTGGLGGLGKEIVKLIMEKGGAVIVLDISTPPEDDIIDGVRYLKCDVSNRKEVMACHEKIKSEIGTVTLLINNAGIATGKSLLDLSYDEIEKTIQINLMASFYTIKTFLPDMIKIRRGYIVTIASVLGYMSPARLSAYGASKSGLISLHESLTYEIGPPSLSPKGVKTLLICPGQLKTTMFTGVRTPSSVLAPELEPTYVAKCVIEALELGRRGEIKLPLYGNFLPIFRSLPWQTVEIFRRISGIDSSMHTFKSAAKEIYQVATKASSIVSPVLPSSISASLNSVPSVKNLSSLAKSAQDYTL